MLQHIRATHLNSMLEEEMGRKVTEEEHTGKKQKTGKEIKREERE